MRKPEQVLRKHRPDKLTLTGRPPEQYKPFWNGNCQVTCKMLNCRHHLIYFPWQNECSSRREHIPREVHRETSTECNYARSICRWNLSSSTHRLSDQIYIGMKTGDCWSLSSWIGFLEIKILYVHTGNLI